MGEPRAGGIFHEEALGGSSTKQRLSTGCGGGNMGLVSAERSDTSLLIGVDKISCLLWGPFTEPRPWNQVVTAIM